MTKKGYYFFLKQTAKIAEKLFLTKIKRLYKLTIV